MESSISEEHKINFKKSLTILVLINLLAGIVYVSHKYLIPRYQAYMRMRVSGQHTACSYFLGKIGVALEEYREDKGSYPDSLPALKPDYIKHIPTCPAASKDTYSEGYILSEDKKQFTVFCKGNYHKHAQVDNNFPQFSSKFGLQERKKFLDWEIKQRQMKRENSP